MKKIYVYNEKNLLEIKLKSEKDLENDLIDAIDTELEGEAEPEEIKAIVIQASKYVESEIEDHAGGPEKRHMSCLRGKVFLRDMGKLPQYDKHALYIDQDYYEQALASAVKRVLYGPNYGF